MKLAVFDDHRVGVVNGHDVLDVTTAVPAGPPWPPTYMNSLINEWDRREALVLEAQKNATGLPLAEARLLPPVPAPSTIVAAPANYRKHIDEMGSRGSGGRSMRDLGFFLLAPSSVVGPGARVLLPKKSSREFHHECELAVVIGRCCKNVNVSDALSHVFGYTCLMDLTMRMTDTLKEERVMRKSFDTFTPMGPWLVTADEVPDPQNLTLELYVDDERRQRASTSDMIVSIAEQIALASSVMTLHPGDVLATGSPDGVGPIQAGNTVRIEIENVGGFAVEVDQAREFAPVRF